MTQTPKLPTIRELPAGERPREKMLSRGADQLADRDLLALMVGHGTRTVSALGLADKLLARFGSLVSLADASIEELTLTPGVGEAKASRLKAACEIGRRLNTMRAVERPVIRSAADVANLLLNEMATLDREQFRCLLLDTKYRLLEVVTVSIGHLNGTLVHPREVFKAAIRRSSEAILVVHNHPSGDPTPSTEDIAVTHRLVQAGTLLGIDVLDHVIIGAKGYVSLRQDGHMANGIPGASLAEGRDKYI